MRQGNLYEQHWIQLTTYDQAIKSKRRDKIAIDLANSLGYYLQMIADYAGAQPYYEQALASNKKVLGEEHSLTKIVRNNLEALNKH